MKRPTRNQLGYYVIDGKQYKELFGSRIQVWNGSAFKTSGSLRRHQLMMNKWNRIVSADKHKSAKKEKRLEKHGFFAKRGSFGYVKRTPKRTAKNRSKKNKA